jgi:hypothetical protein
VKANNKNVFMNLTHQIKTYISQKTFLHPMDSFIEHQDEYIAFDLVNGKTLVGKIKRGGRVQNIAMLADCIIMETKSNTQSLSNIKDRYLVDYSILVKQYAKNKEKVELPFFSSNDFQDAVVLTWYLGKELANVDDLI